MPLFFVGVSPVLTMLLISFSLWRGEKRVELSPIIATTKIQSTLLCIALQGDYTCFSSGDRCCTKRCDRLTFLVTVLVSLLPYARASQTLKQVCCFNTCRAERPSSHSDDCYVTAQRQQVLSRMKMLLKEDFRFLLGDQRSQDLAYYIFTW